MDLKKHTFDAIGVNFLLFNDDDVEFNFIVSLLKGERSGCRNGSLWWWSTDGSTGGEGGFSRIRFTMKQNEEYVIAGLIDSINTPFVYRKGALMACVGEGGKTAGVVGKLEEGGDGGGVGIAGENGIWNSNGGSGAGGNLIAEWSINS